MSDALGKLEGIKARIAKGRYVAKSTVDSMADTTITQALNALDGYVAILEDHIAKYGSDSPPIRPAIDRLAKDLDVAT